MTDYQDATCYRPDFYCLPNVIGYTGDLTLNPTIYFQSGHSYGRITTAHRRPDNVGREMVITHAGYRIVNVRFGNRFKAVEYQGQRQVHRSRHEFIPREDFGPYDINRCHSVILLNPDLKTMFHATRDAGGNIVRDAAGNGTPLGLHYQEASRTKDAAMSEMMGVFNALRNPGTGNARPVGIGSPIGGLAMNLYGRTWE